MKITIDPKPFSEALSSIAPPRRTARPIHAAILVLAQGDKLTLTSSTDERSIALSLPCDVSTPGIAVLPHSTLSESVGCCKGAATLELADGDTTAQLRSGRQGYRIPVAGTAEEYPDFPKLHGKVTTMRLEADRLLQAISEAAYAMSPDETKMILRGLHIRAIDDGLDVAATDGHRLATTRIEMPINGDNAITLPATTINLLPKLLQEEPEVTLSYDDFQCVIEQGDVKFFSRLLDGQYPNYRQLFPNQFAWSLTCEKGELRSALDAVSFVAALTGYIATLELLEGALYISADAGEVGAAVASLEVQTDGDSPKLALNLKYLKDAIGGSGTVTLAGNTPTSPIVLRYASVATALIMPVQVRS